MTLKIQGLKVATLIISLWPSSDLLEHMTREEDIKF